MMGIRSSISAALFLILAGQPLRLRADEPAASEGTAPTAADADALSQWPRLLVQDTKTVLGAPAAWDRKQWGGFAIAAGVVIGTGIALDHPVREAFQRNRSESRDRLARSFEKLGSTYAVAAIGGAYLYGWMRHDGKLRAAGTDAFMASVVTGVLLRPALKFAVGRARPEEGAGTHSFRPFGGDDSFPSGHTLEAFTVASVFAAHYPEPWVQCTAYGLASLAGLARLEQDAHFASDVVAGALLGVAVGRAVVRAHEPLRASVRTHARFEWMPVLSAEYQGLRLGLIY